MRDLSNLEGEKIIHRVILARDKDHKAYFSPKNLNPSPPIDQFLSFPRGENVRKPSRKIKDELSSIAHQEWDKFVKENKMVPKEIIVTMYGNYKTEVTAVYWYG